MLEKRIKSNTTFEVATTTSIIGKRSWSVWKYQTPAKEDKRDGELKLKWSSTCCLMRTCGFLDRMSKDWFYSINYSTSRVHKLRLNFIKSSYFDFHSRLWRILSVKATSLVLFSLLLLFRYWKCFQWKWRNSNKPRPRTPPTQLTLFDVLLIPLHSPFVFTFESRWSVYTQVAIVCTHGASIQMNEHISFSREFLELLKMCTRVGKTLHDRWKELEMFVGCKIHKVIHSHSCELRKTHCTSTY